MDNSLVVKISSGGCESNKQFFYLTLKLLFNTLRKNLYSSKVDVRDRKREGREGGRGVKRLLELCLISLLLGEERKCRHRALRS